MENIKDIFIEIENHLLYDEVPSNFIKEALSKGKLDDMPFDMIKKLKATEQNLKFHPEGNVLNHTLMVVDQARKNLYKANDKKVLMWSALLHDIGKPATTKLRKGKLTSYNHDKVGKEECINFLTHFNLDKEFIIKVSSMVRWHMQNLFYNKDLPFKNFEAMVSEVDINDMMLLSFSDRMGRGNLTKEDKIKIEEDINNFKAEAEKIKLKLSK